MYEYEKQAMVEQFRNDVETDIANNPDGILIYDISIRGGTIETDIISFAEQYGFDPEWTEEEKEIIENETSPDHYIEYVYETSQKAEDYLNAMLEEHGINGWIFGRFSEGEIWGLFPIGIEIMQEWSDEVKALYNWYIEEISDEITPDDVEVLDYDLYGLTLVDICGNEYAIGDDEEADGATLEYIKESVWAFNADFIAGEIGNYDLKPAIEALIEECEDGNDGIMALIESFTTIEDFAQNAISADGRGHFISSYDGEEYETEYNGMDYYIYRVN